MIELITLFIAMCLMDILILIYSDDVWYSEDRKDVILKILNRPKTKIVAAIQLVIAVILTLAEYGYIND